MGDWNDRETNIQKEGQIHLVKDTRSFYTVESTVNIKRFLWKLKKDFTEDLPLELMDEETGSEGGRSKKQQNDPHCICICICICLYLYLYLNLMDGETGSEGGGGKKQPNDPLTTRPQLIASQQAASYYPVIF